MASTSVATMITRDRADIEMATEAKASLTAEERLASSVNPQDLAAT